MVVQAAEKNSVFTQSDICNFLKEKWIFPASGRKKQEIYDPKSETGSRGSGSRQALAGCSSHIDESVLCCEGCEIRFIPSNIGTDEASHSLDRRV